MAPRVTMDLTGSGDDLLADRDQFVTSINLALAQTDEKIDRVFVDVVEPLVERAERAVIDAEAAAAAGATAAKFADSIAAGRASVADGETFGVRADSAGGTEGFTRPMLFTRQSASTQTLNAPMLVEHDIHQTVAVSRDQVFSTSLLDHRRSLHGFGLRTNGAVEAISNHAGTDRGEPQRNQDHTRQDVSAGRGTGVSIDHQLGRRSQ